MSGRPDPRPPRRPVPEAALGRLVRLLRRGPAAVLTGAGCSTASGIPDYRGPATRDRDHDPVRYGDFVRRPEARTRYWARSAVGWPRVRDAAPNDAHRALAALESGGAVVGVITQNVDGLHGAAGSRRVVELHGSVSDVRCLDCGAPESRRSVQRRLLAMNPGFRDRRGGANGSSAPGGRGPRDDGSGRGEGADGDDLPRLAPDGDAEVGSVDVRRFTVPGCRRCGGVLKPDVVFFGESVPGDRVERARRLLDDARVLLVAGSSLSVYSGYRFVLRAEDRGTPVAIVNVGAIRADAAARARVEGRVGDVLPRLVDRLLGARAY